VDLISVIAFDVFTLSARARSARPHHRCLVRSLAS
jgi:hypothetical protein